MKKIKLIWDFRGNAAFKTAEHHAVHLKEFALKEQLTLSEAGIEKMNENHTIAFLIVTEPEMIKVRDALKPNRGEIYNAT